MRASAAEGREGIRGYGGKGRRNVQRCKSAGGLWKGGNEVGTALRAVLVAS